MTKQKRFTEKFKEAVRLVGIKGEVRLVERAFGISPDALTEILQRMNTFDLAAWPEAPRRLSVRLRRGLALEFAPEPRG